MHNLRHTIPTITNQPLYHDLRCFIYHANSKNPTKPIEPPICPKTFRIIRTRTEHFQKLEESAAGRIRLNVRSVRHYDHSTCMHYDHRTCMYHVHSTCTYYDHNTCMSHDHGTCMSYNERACTMFIVYACTMIIAHA